LSVVTRTDSEEEKAVSFILKHVNLYDMLNILATIILYILKNVYI